MSITDTDAPATPTPFAAAQDPNPVKSVPPFANPLTEWRGFAAQAWAAWFNQVAQKVAEQLAQVAYSGSYNDLINSPGTVYQSPAAGLIPAMAGDNQAQATASVDTHSAWMAFDQNDSTAWQNSAKLPSGTAATLTYTFAATFVAKSVSLLITTRPTNGFKLEASNDGSTWTQLYSTTTQLPASPSEYSITFSNSTAYKIYRFTLYATNNGWLAVQTLQIYGNVAAVDFGGKDFINVGRVSAAAEMLSGALGIGGASAPAYPLDVRDGVTSQVHIAPADQDDGTWITSYASGGHPASYLSAGAIFNGSNWIAKNSQAAILGLDPTGKFVVFLNTGLTVGATFTPTPAAVGSAQTPWTSNINAAGFQLQNLGSISGQVAVIPTSNPTAPVTNNQLVLRESSANPSYGLYLGYATFNSTWNGCVQAIIGGVNATLFLNPNGGNVGLGMSAAPAYQLQMTAQAAGPQANWVVPSDIRQKRNVEPMADDSLAIIEKLNWIRFEYNGLGSSPEGMKSIGLSAQELRELIPEAVGSVKTKLRPDDREETELLDIQYHYVSVHAARAIKQLSDRVKKLEAALARHLTLTE